MKRTVIDPVIAKLSPERKAALIAYLHAIPDDSDVFPGYLGNKSTVTLLKPLRRPKSAPRQRAASRA
jgi:hypothetical protein